MPIIFFHGPYISGLHSYDDVPICWFSYGVEILPTRIGMSVTLSLNAEPPFPMVFAHNYDGCCSHP